MSTAHTPYIKNDLVSRINNRDMESYGELYSLIFNELYYYASRLYSQTEVDAGDAVQDAFVALCQSPALNFTSIAAVKAYLYVSVHNNFKKYLRHNHHKDRFVDYCLYEADRFEADVYQSELFSMFNHILDLLPEETAEIFRLFFRGWSVEEIADRMGKSKQTVYNIRSQAIAKLRAKLSKEVVSALLIVLFGSVVD